MTLAPGSRLGPYEVIGPIGAGGMGEVYRARDSRLDRDVAIKVLPENVSTSPSAMERFGREAKAIAALSHPGILSIHDFGMEGRTAYAVTELLEGETLHERLAQGALTPRKAVEFAVQIANALASAHERGVVHRDLKPANLFLTRDGRVKILDFGLARWQESAAGSSDGKTPEAQTRTRHTEPGLVLGTAGYMAPEQVRGQVADHRADIFALGCVIYEMLSGRRAFARETSAETMTAILREDPPDLSVPGRTIPPGLEKLVRRCLEKRPDDRLQSARDLAIAFEAVSLGDSSTVQTAVQAPSGKVPVRVVVAALAALLLAAAAYRAGTRAASPAAPAFPTFTRLTFRRGLVSAARFGPDGRSVVYSASWDGAPLRLFTTQTESAQASTAALHEAHLLSVSSSNELAVMLRPALGLLYSVGTLARAPMGAGAPRAVLEGVQQADWSREGELAVVRTSRGHSRLEFPVGTVRYETSGWLSAPRLSPKGDSIAFIEHPIEGDDRGWPALVDLKSGAKRDLAKEFGTLSGLAWRPDGNELCAGGGFSIYCMGMNGGEPRRVFRGMTRLILEDISAEERILATAFGLQGAAKTGSIGGNEVDLGETPAIVPIDIDPRERRVLFESLDYGVYLETPGKGPAVRLGDGIPLGLSPDGARVLNLVPGQPTQLSLIPTGAGATVLLPRGSIARHIAAVFAPDGKRIVVSGSDNGRGSRLYVQDLPGGEPRPISGEGVRLPRPQPRLVSPDGRFIAAIGPDQAIALYPLDGGDPRPIAGLETGFVTIGWTDRPGVLFVSPEALTRRVPVFRHDVATGRHELWREFGPADPIGSPLTLRLQVTPDGSQYAYLYFLPTTELYLIDGVLGKSPDPARPAR
jgi:roadblock/LC7 domain-containing protein